MDSLFGAEGSLIVRFVVAFVIVLALIGLTFWLIRRFGAARVGAAAQRGRQPRLAVIDAAPVDGRRRLVLVRRDNVEHLLMIGGPSDIVVEQNIVRAVPVNPPRDVPVPRAPAPKARVRSRDAARTLDDDTWVPRTSPRPRRAPDPSAQPPRARRRAPTRVPRPLVRAPLTDQASRRAAPVGTAAARSRRSVESARRARCSARQHGAAARSGAAPSGRTRAAQHQ